MLTESEKSGLEAHLQSCEDCQRTAKELTELKRKLQTMPVPSPKPEMWNRVMRHFRLHARRREFTFIKPKIWLAAAASVALLFGALVLVWQKSTVTRSNTLPLNLIVSYHADSVSLALGDIPVCHLIATAELSEAVGHE